MEGTATRAPAVRRKSSALGSGKKRATLRSSQAAPDLVDAAPGQDSRSRGSEPLQEKNPPVLQKTLPARVPRIQSTQKLDGRPQRDKKSVPRAHHSPGVPRPLSHEPARLPKEEEGPVDQEKEVLRLDLVGCKLQRVVDKLKLRRPEKSQACELVNTVVDHLRRQLPLCEPAFKGIEKLGTGSYYEQVKISTPNEFDVMLKLEVCRIELEKYDDDGAFYFVKFKRNPKGNPLINFLDDERLSASKLQTKFRNIIKEQVKHIKEMDIIVERKKPTSPAVTLLIREPKEVSVDIILTLESKSSWPPSTQGALPIENWLGRKVKNEFKFRPVYLIPKPAKEGNGFQANTWRLSFSHIEKDMIRYHGKSKTCCEKKEVKCCRKTCLKLMKYLLEQLKKKFEKRKEMNKFHSYHVKTAFFHFCVQTPDDSQWQLGNLGQCFDNYVSYFLQCLREGKLIHFFIPKCNLFSCDIIDKTSQIFLLRQIEFQKNNMFPVFDE